MYHMFVESLSESQASDYLNIITELFPHLSGEDLFRFDMDDDEDEYDMDYSDQDNAAVSLNKIRMECLNTINSPNHVAKFISLTRGARSSDTILQLSKLCHVMTSKLGQLVHSNR